MTFKDRVIAADTDVVVIGAGIIGMTSALQFAKRGLQVTLIDNLRDQKPSFKVGESFLVFTSAFLRTVGELDEFISHESYIKRGVWFTAGAEHRDDFRGTTEWAVNADPHPPHYLYDMTPDKKWFRCMFLDMQIVRPDAEAVMREKVRQHANIRFLDAARVQQIAVSENEQAHQIAYRHDGQKNVIHPRWIVDCSGRNRLLARKLGHAAESREQDEPFQTTAVWGQFSEITDACFDERWRHLMHDGQVIQRDHYTVHLWGEGYWIWVIRLSQQRISIGATFDKQTPPPGETPREQFWHLIGRYPVLKGMISEQTLLEFQVLPNVQHWTDTFVSTRRYAMLGDAASIIDAYYSQGIALALVTSWHVTNIMQRDIGQGQLDQRYINEVNDATRQDWHMLRNAVKVKYSGAVADSRFFLLSHILDMAIFWCMGSTRAKLTHWLVATEGETPRETPSLRRLRHSIESRLFYSRSPYWLWLSPQRVQRFQKYLQTRLAQRAQWRLQHGIATPTLTSILSLEAPLPQIWKLLWSSANQHVDISSRDFVKPAALRPPATISWLDRLPISANTRLAWVIHLRPVGLLCLFALGYAWDAIDTRYHQWRKRA
ncbi:NAD(P)/FAD-dependent oxidoreductase [Dickeya dadantii]|uniref:NAD(P)/FAD-dependent oxidoreductase n=1 Tax=Dickeya dadantii TaxID=204038 RepID=UPI0021D8D05F|nr:NAD(P)/FAD-dependent oxidoreductase [Dickeya dadantii]